MPPSGLKPLADENPGSATVYIYKQKTLNKPLHICEAWWKCTYLTFVHQTRPLSRFSWFHCCPKNVALQWHFQLDEEPGVTWKRSHVGVIGMMWLVSPQRHSSACPFWRQGEDFVLHVSGAEFLAEDNFCRNLVRGCFFSQNGFCRTRCNAKLLLYLMVWKQHTSVP